MARGNGARIRRKLRRKITRQELDPACFRICPVLTHTLNKGRKINPQVSSVNGAVDVAYAGLWQDREGFRHCTRRRQKTPVPLIDQLYKPERHEPSRLIA